MPTALLVSVTEESDQGRANLSVLSASLQRQGCAVIHVVVVRGAEVDASTPGASAPVLAADGDSSYVRCALTAPRRIALSSARNLALTSPAFQESLREADVVGFPDDDCHYPDGLLATVIGFLDPPVDIVTVPYAPSAATVDRRRFPPVDRALTLSGVMRYTSSNTFFVRPALAHRLQRFDERFGLGTDLRSSEDAEYLFRALLGGSRGRYLGAQDICAFHPYKRQRPAQYYTGNLALLAMYCTRRPVVAALFIRRLLGGLLMVLRGSLPPKAFLRSIAAAARVAGRRRS